MSFLSVAFAEKFIASYIYAKKLSGLFLLEREMTSLKSRTVPDYIVPNMVDITRFFQGYENADELLALLLKSFGPHMPQEDNGSKGFVGARPDLRLQITQKCKNNRCSKITVSFDKHVDEDFYQQATDVDLKLDLISDQSIEVGADSFTCYTCNQREGCLQSQKYFINSNSPYLVCKLDALISGKPDQEVQINETGIVPISISDLSLIHI